MNELGPESLELEQRTHRLLRQLPQREAPRSLEQRVWSQLDRLASLPWWRRSFGYWPLAARVGFLVLSAGVAALILYPKSDPLMSWRPLSGFSGSLTWAAACARVFASIAHSIPAPWLYGTLIAAATLYSALFVLGAAAYRSLYLDRPAH